MATLSSTDSNGTSTHSYTYDDIYQLTDADYPVDFNYLATDTTFNYDDVGNRTFVVDDSGTLSYTSNDLNQYTAVADANCTYDNNGNMTYDGINEYTYDAENRLIQVRRLGSLAAACDTTLALTTGGDAEWFSQTAEYDYDWDAAESGAIDANEVTWMEAEVEGPGTIQFRHKMSSADGDEFSFYIGTSLKGTWTSAGSWVTRGQWSVGTGTHTLKWKYSKTGSGSSTGECWIDKIEWSGDVPDSGAAWDEIEYTYDSSGRRIQKDVDGEVTKYLYDRNHCIAEYDANDTLLRKYIYGPGVDQPICMIDVNDSNTVYYYHYDGQGSVVALSDSSGDTVQVYEYSVFGQVAASDPNHTNPFLFTGRRFDSETGLYYYRARYYNPYIGRFLQTDPIGYGDGMNTYAYCGNNPTTCVDPFGLLRVWTGSFTLYWKANRLADWVTAITYQLYVKHTVEPRFMKWRLSRIWPNRWRGHWKDCVVKRNVEIDYTIYGDVFPIGTVSDMVPLSGIPVSYDSDMGACIGAYEFASWAFYEIDEVLHRTNGIAIPAGAWKASIEVRDTETGEISLVDTSGSNGDGTDWRFIWRDVRLAVSDLDSVILPAYYYYPKGTVALRLQRESLFEWQIDDANAQKQGEPIPESWTDPTKPIPGPGGLYAPRLP
jgi:RHS repeat-associated protein